MICCIFPLDTCMYHQLVLWPMFDNSRLDQNPNPFFLRFAQNFNDKTHVNNKMSTIYTRKQCLFLILNTFYAITILSSRHKLFTLTDDSCGAMYMYCGTRFSIRSLARSERKRKRKKNGERESTFDSAGQCDRIVGI